MEFFFIEIRTINNSNFFIYKEIFLYIKKYSNILKLVVTFFICKNSKSM